ncbi:MULTISPECIES: hypothetical protein [Acaryochloris]|uniref:Uncharacterized protein n=1 Tax=Acaryochloris marina (strain MBIC 11017) TaxID=329726 RepID=B0C5P0_ACAM1|nr:MULTISPECIES: hypothetical protein [Acaryochloris]ABW28761.1 hypothetical protein AM1_3774 [Acaryochloris marina MBIC11017]KAI9133917.1 hypothetical protein ON05_011830 [Acaryochloris sp. CCMEE 5410]BDM77750.1 hypothetical protein AM10699_06220 [Acaryochloris marina MBIC10699]
MLCQTCQRQSHCLTHQLAAQDQNLHRMLENLQGCQRRQPYRVKPSPSHTWQKTVRWMEKLAHRLSP